jgi:hypothetical protein
MKDMTGILTKVTLQSFCKSNKILGVPIEESYKRFKAVYESDYMNTQYEFEKGLEALGKGVIKNLKKKCMDFRQNEYPNSHDAFIERHEFITRRFWGEIVEGVSSVNPKVAPVVNHKSKVPSNWNALPLLEKIEFIKNIQGDDEFKAYMMALDPKMKDYFKTYFKVPSNLSEMALSSLAPKMPSNVSEVALSLTSPTVAPLEPVQPIVPAPEPKRPRNTEKVPQSHKEKMPV